MKLLEENLNILVKPSKHCKNELENMYIRVSQIDVQGVHNSRIFVNLTYQVMQIVNINKNVCIFFKVDMFYFFRK